jgi:hypothetical protein
MRTVFFILYLLLPRNCLYPQKPLVLYFFGKYARYKKYYEALAPYHQKIIFADQSNFEMFDEQEHPAPYFINLFD